MIEEPSNSPPRERNWDAFAAVIAALIGLLALCVSGYTAYLQRQQTSAQVWPRVELSVSNLDPQLIVSNYGVGPARVTGMRVSVDGKPVKSWLQMMKTIGYSGNDGYAYIPLNGKVLPPGAELQIFLPSANPISQAMFTDFLEQKKHKITMQVCYCSVLDECWLYDDSAVRRNGRNQPVDKCQIPEREQFDN
jgi:hypothetical protein